MSSFRFVTVRSLGTSAPLISGCVVDVTDTAIDLVTACAFRPGSEFLLSLAGAAGAVTQVVCLATRCTRFSGSQFRIGATLVRVLQVAGTPVSGVTASGVEVDRLRDAILGN